MVGEVQMLGFGEDVDVDVDEQSSMKFYRSPDRIDRCHCLPLPLPARPRCGHCNRCPGTRWRTSL